MLSLPQYCSATLELLIATKKEARELLLKTRSEYPGAAHRIIEAMNLAGLTP